MKKIHFYDLDHLCSDPFIYVSTHFYKNSVLFKCKTRLHDLIVQNWVLQLYSSKTQVVWLRKCCFKSLENTIDCSVHHNTSTGSRLVKFVKVKTWSPFNYILAKSISLMHDESWLHDVFRSKLCMLIWDIVCMQYSFWFNVLA